MKGPKDPDFQANVGVSTAMVLTFPCGLAWGFMHSQPSSHSYSLLA
jgi:hypothetical protein